MNEDYLLWGDIETSGLEPEFEALLEVGCILTDLDLNILTGIKMQVTHSNIDEIRNKAVPFVQDMHDKNGLWDDCKPGGPGGPMAVVEIELMNWLAGIEDVYGIGKRTMPLAGSSLALDRQFLAVSMPTFHNWFHYRSIDNSSTKELCRRYNPVLYAQLGEVETDHRVFSCLKASIYEFKFYADNFLIQGDQ